MKGELPDEFQAMRRQLADLKRLKRIYQLAAKHGKEYEERYKALFDRSVYCVYLHDFKGNFIDANRAALNLLGYTKREMVHLNIASILDAEDLPLAYREIEEIKKNGYQKKPNEFKLKKRDGGQVWVIAEASLIYREGKPFAIQGIARDITLRKKVEEALKKSLKDKEVLLREVHHRVNNNLQVISSLLDLRSLRMNHPQMIALCKDAQAKIHTMALVYSHLYQGNTFAEIDIGNYIYELVEYLARMYADKKKCIVPMIRPSHVVLSVAQAVPCAIVLNEAIANAFKHAFPKVRKGTISISMKMLKKDSVVMTVKDNGIGFSGKANRRQRNSLGVKLMRNLVQDQLKGTFQIRKNLGTEVLVKFPISKEEPTDEKNINCR
ncbi:MAG: PAS domain S-box protein [Candidatus Aminicenantales bacterium]